MSDSATPSITDFMPLPGQLKVLRDIRKNLDYSMGTHEILLSGSVGSAKSLLLAHIMVTHAIANPFAHVGVGRRVFKDLKDTLLELTKSHCSGVEQVSYHGVTGKFTFQNGSVIRPFSWADAHYKKFRSHEFSMFVIEELTENEDQEFYTEISARVGRLRHINEKLIVCATNPDDPEHWAYRHWMLSDSKRRHVYYTKTADNPYLPESYIEQLREQMDPLLARRMIDGEWIPIRGSTLYHQYDSVKNRSTAPYQLKTGAGKEVHWCWDFNIGENKPLSSCFYQHDGRAFHIYQDLVIHGLRTEDMLEEAWSRGYLDHDVTLVINGDATGKHRDTRSKHSDYEIIRIWLANAKTRDGSRLLRYRFDVPLSNPKIRERHNIVNGILHNAKGERRLIVYPGAPVVHEGLMLTKLKHGADYIEDDSKPYQHVTTALGYGLIAKLREQTGPQVTMIRR